MQVSENDMDVRRIVQKKFHSRSIYLSKDSLTFLTDFVKSLDHDTREKVMAKVIKEAENSQSQSESLDVTKLKGILSRGTKSREIDKDILFKLENAFDWKRIVLDKAAKKLTPLTDENFRSWEKSTTFDCLRQRFELVRQLLVENSGCVSSIDSLFTHRDEEVRLLGMLSRGAGDSLIAEDLTGTVLLDMSDVKYNPGLYFEGGIYVFLGNYEAGRLYVENISLPLLKNITPSQMMSTHLNIPKGVSPRSEDKIVLMSDVHLDNPRVMQALHKLLSGFMTSLPDVIILCGRFLSTQLAHGYTEAYSTAFRHLANLLANFPAYAAKTDFILVPSIEDPLPMTTLPQ
ncbi:DNA polymerase alpha/epsilon subunit B domain-containing protein [Ditylenchus destructor]|nr:DNA polymerase alpha/epsilon subunit B domain-containing protein [Ditylenchus destructor]